jgi:hypothetical protein
METWSFQVRIHLADSVAGLARQDPTNPILESLTTVLSKHNVSMKSQLDAWFCQLVEAEEERRQERASSEGVGRILGDFGDVAPRNESRRELFAIE